MPNDLDQLNELKRESCDAIGRRLDFHVSRNTHHDSARLTFLSHLTPLTCRAMHPDDTIAAIATPLGEGGLAVIRISGPQALMVADRCFRPAGRASLKPSLAASHTIHFGEVLQNGQRVDEVLLSVMRAPRTFTREDVVEIACHGGLLPAKTVLDTLLQNGARLAEPGEFTRRAFLNGRIDLAQAEAVADLIRSRTE